jgi:HoxN/HupN/NixA family high-affinity nickel-transporter
MEDALHNLLSQQGFLFHILRSLFATVTGSWHLYPLGFLFGLGFDTASEVGLLDDSAGQGSAGLPVWSILSFPALFTAAMSLIDASDGAVFWKMSRIRGCLIKFPAKPAQSSVARFTRILSQPPMGRIDLS